jgi:hypothetical protein
VVKVAVVLPLLLLLGPPSARAAYHEIQSEDPTPIATCLNVPAGTPVAYEIQGTFMHSTTGGPWDANGCEVAVCGAATAGWAAPGLKKYSIVALTTGAPIQLGVGPGVFISPGGPIQLVVNDDFYPDNAGQFKLVIGPAGPIGGYAYQLNGIANGSGWGFGFGQPAQACVHWTLATPAGSGAAAVAALWAQRINDQGFALVTAGAVGAVLNVYTPGGGWDMWVQDGGPDQNCAPGPCVVAAPQPVPQDGAQLSLADQIVITGLGIISQQGASVPAAGPAVLISMIIVLIAVGIIGIRRRRSGAVQH